MIKEFILQNLISKSGKIISKRCSSESFLNSEEHHQIINLTSHLLNFNLYSKIKYILSNSNRDYKCLTCGCDLDRMKDFCSIKCCLTNQELNKKKQDTMIEKYGTKNIFASNKFKKENKERNLKLYGFDNYAKTEEYLEKCKSTNLEKFGCEWPTQNNEVITKSKQSLFKHWYNNILSNKDIYNISPLFTENDFDMPIFDRRFSCDVCGYIFNQWSDHLLQCRCIKCFPLNKSKNEIEIYNYIIALKSNIKIDTEIRNIITPLELDLYIPEYNIAIEHDGIYWHSYGKGDIENRKYHLNKTEMCLKQNISLLHIFENEWENIIKQSIWKSIIAGKLGINKTIGARKCKIILLHTKESSLFLNENHLQGNCNSKIKLGLEYNNELVCVLTLSKSRFNKNYDWEITRFANKKYINVIGGFSKLLKYFRSNNPGSIITYADKRYSNGDLYRKTGFIELKDSSPNYFYSNGNNLHSRINFQKHKLKDKLKTFDINKTEAENMFENGFRRIWDCGNKVFILKGE